MCRTIILLYQYNTVPNTFQGTESCRKRRCASFKNHQADKHINFHLYFVSMREENYRTCRMYPVFTDGDKTETFLVLLKIIQPCLSPTTMLSYHTIL